MYEGLNVGYISGRPTTEAIYVVDVDDPPKNVDAGYCVVIGVISIGGGVADRKHILAEPLTNTISYVNSVNCVVVNVLAPVKVPCVTVMLLPEKSPSNFVSSCPCL